MSAFGTGLLTEKQSTTRIFSSEYGIAICRVRTGNIQRYRARCNRFTERRVSRNWSRTILCVGWNLRFYAQDVQVDNRSEVHRSYGLMSLYYDNCVMFGQACKLSLNKLGHRTVVNSGKLRTVASQLELSALEWTKQIPLAAERKLRWSLGRTSRNDGLDAYATQTGLLYGTALMSANWSLN